VEQQSTPWRVFDAPASDADPATSTAKGPSTPGPQALTLASPRVAFAGLAAALGVGALAVVLALGQSGDGSVAGPGASDATLATGGPDMARGQIVVDVVGAVVRPGVYHLPTGSRVGDAITAAGGFGPRVDAAAIGAALNLAAPLKDGEQVRVPSRDDGAPSTGSGGGSPGSGGSGGGGGSGGKLVDLNSATEAELDALPGIGPVTAGKIIEARGKAPFKTVDDLRTQGLVGQKTFDQIKALVTVG
jgi:competence protein ComEA